MSAIWAACRPKGPRFRDAERLRVLIETLDQHVGQDPNFCGGILTGRAHNVYTRRRGWKTTHDRYERSRRNILVCHAVREPCEAEPRYCGGGDSDGIVSLDPPPRVNGYVLVAIHKPPTFRPLH